MLTDYDTLLHWVDYTPNNMQYVMNIVCISIVRIKRSRGVDSIEHETADCMIGCERRGQHECSNCMLFYINQGATVAQWSSTGLLVNRSSERSGTRGMIHTKIHLISQGCPRSSKPYSAESWHKTPFIHI